MNEWNLWSVFQQIIIILAIVMQMFVAVKIINQARGAEQLVRSTAVASGVLIFLGSQAFGITFADLMLMAVTNVGIYQIIIIGTVIPALIGVIVAHVTIYTVKKGTDFAIRILLLVGIFTLFQIGYLNYYAISKTSLPISQALLPNLCYSLSVMLWVVFNFKEDAN